MICARLKALAGLLYLTSVNHVGTTDVQGLHHCKTSEMKRSMIRTDIRFVHDLWLTAKNAGDGNEP